MMALAALSAVAGWPLEASAAGPSWLEWSAPPGCPDGDDIERRVGEWVEGRWAESSDLSVTATLRTSGDQWDVRVVVTRGGHIAERLVTVSSCEAAADFVAIAIVLAVDPDLAEQLESDLLAVSSAAVARPQEEAPVTPRAGPEPADPPSQADAGPAAGPPAVVAPPSASPLPPEEAVSSDAATGWSFRRWKSNWQPHATLWGEEAWQSLPRPAVGVGLGLGLDHRRWSVALGARRLLPVTVFPERAAAPIEFSLTGVRCTLGYRLLAPPVQLAPLVSLEGGAVQTHQRGATSETVGAPWWQVGLGAGLLVRLSPRVTLTGELELSLPLTQPTFVLNDRSEVYQVGAGGRGLLGVRYLFFDSR